MVPVDDHSVDTLLKVISDHTEKGLTIVSDCWKAYDCLQSEGYKHLKVNQSLNFQEPECGVHMNISEQHWRDLMNLVPKYGHCKRHFVG